MPTFSLLLRPPNLSVQLQPNTERSSTALRKRRTRSFGNMLEPRYIFGAESLDQ